MKKRLNKKESKKIGEMINRIEKEIKKSEKIIEKISNFLHKVNLNFMIELYYPKPGFSIEKISKKYCDILAVRIFNLVNREKRR